MKIVITYSLKSAAGVDIVKGCVAYSLKEAEELCQAIEKVGYKILDVTREE